MEEKKNVQMVQVDANFIKQEVEELMKTPIVQKVIYLQKVLEQLNVEEAPTEKKTKNETKSASK